MKAIMIAIKPKYCELIMNGEKTIEVRKNKALATAIQKLIDENGYADIYAYCSKGRTLQKQCSKIVNGKMFDVHWNTDKNEGGFGGFNGKVLFKFRCYKVEEIKNNLAMRFFTESADEKELSEKSCLNGDQLFWYLAPQELKVKCCGYAIHISDLEIFDKPKELSELKHYSKPNCESCQFQYSSDWCDYYREVECDGIPLTKAPQTFCYVEVH